MTDAPLMLSVSGARGIVGLSMTPQVARSLVLAWFFILKNELGRPPSLVIGRDSRPSGQLILKEVSNALLECGCTIFDIGLVATPTVGFAINKLGADGGVVITASHNSKEWNGVKLLDSYGTAPPFSLASKVIQKFKSGDFDKQPSSCGKSIVSNEDMTKAHVEKVLSNIDCESIRKANFRIVIDSINGAGCEGAHLLATSLGIEFVQINGSADGEFAHPPEPKPEHLGQLSEMVSRESFSVGFAQDPDADRLVVVDEHGNAISEEYTLALATWAWLRRSESKTVCANLSTSLLLDEVVAKFGLTVHRTPVGEAHVAEAMRSLGATIGGEGNGGVILPAVTWVRDSLSAMALILELKAKEMKTISQLVESLPKFKLKKKSIPLSRFHSHGHIDDLLKKVCNETNPEKSDLSDGLRVDYKNGWAHVRASNTEPIVRIIIEAYSDHGVEQIENKIINVLGISF